MVEDFAEMEVRKGKKEESSSNLEVDLWSKYNELNQDCL